MNDKAASFAVRAVIAIIVLILMFVLSPKCDNCHSIISGDKYKAYDKTYCYSCAHKLYPKATWK